MTFIVASNSVPDGKHTTIQKQWRPPSDTLSIAGRRCHAGLRKAGYAQADPETRPAEANHYDGLFRHIHGGCDPVRL